MRNTDFKLEEKHWDVTEKQLKKWNDEIKAYNLITELEKLRSGFDLMLQCEHKHRIIIIQF